MKIKTVNGVQGYVGSGHHFHPFSCEASRRVARLAAQTPCEPLPDYLDVRIVGGSVLAMIGPSGREYLFSELPRSFAIARQEAVECETAFLIKQNKDFKAANAARKNK